MNIPFDPSSWGQPFEVTFQKDPEDDWFTFLEYRRSWIPLSETWSNRYWKRWVRREDLKRKLADPLHNKTFWGYIDLGAGENQKWSFLRVVSKQLNSCIVTPESVLVFTGEPLHVTLGHGHLGHYAACVAKVNLETFGNFYSLRLQKFDEHPFSRGTAYRIVGGSLMWIL